MYSRWTWVRLWIPKKMEVRKMWLKIGEILERFDMHLWQKQYLGDEILEGDAVSWEAIFDWWNRFNLRYGIGAYLTFPDLKSGEQLEWVKLWVDDLKEEIFHENEQPSEHGWLIKLGFSYDTIRYSGREFFDREVIDLSKTLFVEFQGIYGVVGEGSEGEQDYAYKEFVRLMKKKELRSVPVIPGKGLVDWSSILFYPTDKERVKEAIWSPIWFYLLNKERHEASKPYFSSLLIERVEGLPNGGALVLVNYPEFDDNCCCVE